MKCALKASQGYLYPLNQSFFFVHKPATFIRYEDIGHIEFLRLENEAAKASVNRFFDLEVVCKQQENSDGFSTGKPCSFTVFANVCCS